MSMQEVLKPVLLRRMKEDVETLPEKEEVIIWVELTRFQRSYYKALFENQITSLLSHSKKAELPNLRNLAMELRKVCCHPVRSPHAWSSSDRRSAPVQDLDLQRRLNHARIWSLRLAIHLFVPTAAESRCAPVCAAGC